MSIPDFPKAEKLTGDLIPSTASELADVQRTQQWLEASELFLASRNSANTRAAYRLAIKDLLATSELAPWQIDRPDVQRWVEDLRRRKLTANSIRLKVSAISSFFQYLQDEFNLVESNPAAGKSLRPKVNPYRNSRYLSIDEAKALLDAIPQDTARGLQDRAIFITFLYTGRRNSEVRQLRWGDINKRGDQVTYTWSGKGKAREDELPEPAYNAILHYLFAAGRMPLDDREYLFCPLSDFAANLPTVEEESWTRERPLSPEEINRRLKYYAQKAGLRSEKLSVHSLRHTAAMLRKEAGDDVGSISSFLNHSSLAVTQIYLHDLEGRRDHSWQKVQELLGV